MTTGLTIDEARSLFIQGVFGWRPFWKQRMPNGTRKCDCGKRAVRKVGGDWCCSNCIRLDALVEHPIDQPCRLTAEEWEVARVRKNNNRRIRLHRDMLNDSIDSDRDYSEDGGA